MNAASNALDRLSATPALMSAVEQAAMAIARLDTRFSASSVAFAWRRRAAWTGYARALQLQGVEIDEIDIFSWGCGLTIDHRPRRISTLDEFAGFELWWTHLIASNHSHWRDRLPFTASPALSDPFWPATLRALELCRQAARADSGIDAWLWLPHALKGFGVSKAALPCLVDGSRAFRLRATPTGEDWRAVLRSLAKAAQIGLERLQALEGHYHRSMTAIAAERRPGALPALLALSGVSPLLSPQSVARALDLSLPGAGKLLARAADLGLLVEVSGRMAWRRYLVPDMAVQLGFVATPRGRPSKPAARDGSDRAMAATLDAFDREMKALDARLAALGVAVPED